MSYVYVLQGNNFELIKIGMSETPEKRAADISRSSGLELRVAYKREFSRSRAVENGAHKYLSDFRKCGEWFRCSVDEAVQAIEKSYAAVVAFEANTQLIGVRSEKRAVRSVIDGMLKSKLQFIREYHGFKTAKEAAIANGWNVNTYSSHENGNRGIRISQAEKYATAYGVTISELFDETPENSATF